MSAFRFADDDQRWSLLESIIELGNPYLLGSSKDPLWLGQILDGAPFALAQHATERLKKRIEEAQRKADAADREIERAG